MTAGDARAAVLAADRAWLDALLAGDAFAAERLMSPDCSYVHNSGRTEGRAAYLTRIRAGQVRYLMLERHDVDVRIYGSAAVMTGYVLGKSMTLPDQRMHERDAHFLAIWVHSDCGWTLVAYASTRRAK
ncbi:ketosteroid isomerase-like protein [Hephaestia caeni]|uniref:Ketosteroid isomerase-like protein n=1 Tax=Hephaestia caeni TaxID=645617 RepID=A0A397P9A3_9SPHN|nr:nuclear transport factor 2 family protein [Hephaestia caeni]RIA45488.1 ketosteroid isomerase-like protein [Hephaestia caeni]